MQGIANKTESFENLSESLEKLKKSAKNLNYSVKKILVIRGDEGMENKELINFAFYRGNDYYPLSEGAYKAENLTIEVGSTFWFYHPDDDEMQSYYVDTIETAIGQDKTYVCAFSNCSDDFVYEVMSNIHKSC